MMGGGGGGGMPDLSQIVGRPLPDRGMPTGTVSVRVGRKLPGERGRGHRGERHHQERGRRSAQAGPEDRRHRPRVVRGHVARRRVPRRGDGRRRAPEDRDVHDAAGGRPAHDVDLGRRGRWRRRRRQRRTAAARRAPARGGRQGPAHVRARRHRGRRGAGRRAAGGNAGGPPVRRERGPDRQPPDRARHGQGGRHRDAQRQERRRRPGALHRPARRAPRPATRWSSTGRASASTRRRSGCPRAAARAPRSARWRAPRIRRRSPSARAAASSCRCARTRCRSSSSCPSKTPPTRCSTRGRARSRSRCPAASWARRPQENERKVEVRQNHGMAVHGPIVPKRSQLIATDSERKANEVVFGFVLPYHGDTHDFSQPAPNGIGRADPDHRPEGHRPHRQRPRRRARARSACWAATNTGSCPSPPSRRGAPSSSRSADCPRPIPAGAGSRAPSRWRWCSARASSRAGRPSGAGGKRGSADRRPPTNGSAWSTKREALFAELVALERARARDGQARARRSAPPARHAAGTGLPGHRRPGQTARGMSPGWRRGERRLSR